MHNGMDRENLDEHVLTRRRFLSGAAGLVAGGMTLSSLKAQDESGQTVEPAAPVRSSRVVLSETPEAVYQGKVIPFTVAELFRRSLLELQSESSIPDAWRKILGESQHIALKFNGSGADTIGTHRALAQVMVATLAEAGFDPGKILAVELNSTTASDLGIRLRQPTWTKEEIDFGSGRDQFASFLGEVDALINVSFLKHHNIAGFSAGLKNLSHGLVKHPARYHGGGCSPFVADIVAQPIIRNVLKLNIINGLRVVFDRGPDPKEDNVHDAGLLVMGVDPLGTDVIGLSRLDRIRQSRGLPKLAESATEIPYLAAAAAAGLGESRFHAIEVRQVTL